MSNLPTRDLLDAAAGLEPADRALLNLWIHRGMDDDRLAGLTGMSAVAVQARRERILVTLGEQLGATPEDVLAALLPTEPEDDGRQDVSATGGGLATPAPVSSTGLPQPPPAQETGAAGDPPSTPDPQVAPETEGGCYEAKTEAEEELPTSPADASPGPPIVPAAAETNQVVAASDGSGHRGLIWAGVAVAIAVAVAVLLIVLLSSSSSSNKAPDPAPPSTSASATSPPRASATPPTPTAPATASSTTAATTTGPQTTTTSPSHTDRLTGLPGGPKHLTGAVSLTGRDDQLKLRLTVKDLPHVHHGYYAAWLFNSVIDSRRLGRVTRNVANTYRLPAGARRFRFIDISLQPKGVFAHSGESKLRAINPVDGPRTIVHNSRARKPRRLRRASAVHKPGKESRSRTTQRSTHRRTDAAHRRRGKRSRKASTSK